MWKRDKLKEATFFLDKMRSAATRDEFRYCVSAFMTAARSVLQYVRTDVKNDPSRLRWYEERMRSSLVLGYFKDKRDANIHEAPVQMPAQFSMRPAGTLRMAGSLSMRVFRRNGSVEDVQEEPPAAPMPEPSRRPSAEKVSVIYYFDDWGPDDVVTLSQKCLEEVEAFVTEGMTKGFIAD